MTLTCSHAYCLRCLDGLKKEPSPSDPAPPETPTTPHPPPTRTLIYHPQLHDKQQCYDCAICRKKSFGYLDCRELETDLTTLDTPCSNCKKIFVLCELRKHLESCKPQKKTVDADALKNIFNPDFFKQLSQPQAEALKKAQGGENRSTFQCPYCERAK